MQKHHVPIKIYLALALHSILYIQVISLLEKYRCMVNEYTI